MTLHDVERLSRHWRKVPPLRVMVAAVAAALGIKFDQPEKPKPMTFEEFQRMVRATGGKIQGVGPRPG